MPFRLLTALLLLGFVPASPAQQPNLYKDKLRDTLLAREKEGWEIIKKKDAAALKAFLSDDYLAVLADGTRLTKADWLKLLPDFEFVDYQIEPATEIVVPAKDAGILLYRMTFTLSIKGAKPEKHTVYASSAYALRDGKWLNVFYQETPLKK